jgi:hypothetical protein
LDDGSFVHPNPAADPPVTVIRQPILIAHSDEKEIQKDRVLLESRGEFPQKPTIDPRPSFLGGASNTVIDQ